jgi:uncharacterized protein YndB with AHSA1/START domain
MVVTRIFDAPRELVWKAWTDPKYVMQWWGPKGFTGPVCKMDFRVGGKFLYWMRAPDGQEFWNAGEYHEIVPHEKIVSSMIATDEIVNVKQTQVHPGNQSQGWLGRPGSSALLSPGRIVAFPDK